MLAIRMYSRVHLRLLTSFFSRICIPIWRLIDMPLSKEQNDEYQIKLKALRAEIMKGAESIKNGDVYPLDLEGSIQRAMKRIKLDAHRPYI
jgi:hypothetical protein